MSGINDYQGKTGNKSMNNIRTKNLTPKNITPILNSSTPYIIPEDQIIQQEKMELFKKMKIIIKVIMIQIIIQQKKHQKQK